MTENRYNQLRFDISEKVRLHPQQPGMDTLLELDLYPDVEVEDQETHLRIQGFLRLNGKYEPESGSVQENEETAGQEEIAYVIPVEITLPADRVDLDYIASEIESFDYKVLSPFELQIEAELVIDGLLAEAEAEEKKESYEVVDPKQVATFSVHEEPRMEKETETENETEEILQQEIQQEYEYTHVARYDAGNPEESQEQAEEDQFEEDNAEHSLKEDGEKEKKEEEEHVLGEKADQEEKEINIEKDVVSESDDTQESSEKTVSKSMDEGMKLAFNQKRDVEKDQGEPTLTDRLLRHPNTREFDFQELNEDEREKFGIERMKEADDKEKDGTDEEEIQDESAKTEDEEKPSSASEWASWILKDETDNFVKMKMVIVQKEDSIDTIAERYEVPISKIMSWNQMDSSVLEEGQIVYIPVR